MGFLRCEETHRRRNGHPTPRKPFRPHPRCAVLVPPGLPLPSVCSPGPSGLPLPLRGAPLPPRDLALHVTVARCPGTPVKALGAAAWEQADEDTVSDRSPSPASPSANSRRPGGARQRPSTAPPRTALKGSLGAVSSRKRSPLSRFPTSFQPRAVFG